MTLEEWRKDPGLTKAAKKVQENKSYRQMLEVAKNNLPTNHTLPAIGTDSHSFAYAYGVEVGYRRCLATLNSLSDPVSGVETLEAKFEQQ